MQYDREKHHRRSIRLKGYDYTLPGAYFVTLCTRQRHPLFGEIVDGRVNLSALGKIVQDEWLRSMDIRREIRLYEDVVQALITLQTHTPFP
jgi:putative transposase